MIPLPFFDPPAADESLYSSCARFHRASGHRRASLTSTAMFGHDRAALRPDFQVGLDHLERATGGLVSATEATLRERTVLRSYLPFMEAEERWQALNIIKRHPTKDSNRSRVGLSWNNVTVNHELRLCPVCVAEQRDRLGYAYWENSKQLPGVWACVKHNVLLHSVVPQVRSVSCWLSADGAVTEPLPIDNMSRSEFLPLLIRIAHCTHWIGEQQSIHRRSLVAMIRTRLYEAGHTRTECTASSSELAALEKKVFSCLGHAGIPHFRLFQSNDWIRRILKHRRASHPTKWAALLAAAPAVDFATLTQDLRDATERLPQEDLFHPNSTFSVSRAPRSLYRALAAPVSMATAAKAAGVRRSEVVTWLHRDEALSAQWHAAKNDALCTQSKLAIQAAVTANPTLGRYRITMLCSAAVSALEKYEPAALKRLLPPVQANLDRQKRLPWD